jgi:cytochrome c-type biogenesis protein CcmH
VRRRRAPRARVALAIALALALLPGSAAAATCPQTSVADLEDEVMCPVCQTPLGLAQEAPQADRQRAFILERVERCESKATIKAALSAEFGEEVLAVPEDEGFDLAAYLVPVLGLVAGLAACAVAVTRWRGHRPALAAGGRAVGEGETARAPSTRNEGAEPEGDDAERGAAGAEARARLERDLERYDL